MVGSHCSRGQQLERVHIKNIVCQTLEMIRDDKRSIQTCVKHRVKQEFQTNLFYCQCLTLSVADQSQASSIENKQDWIKHIREVIQERTIHLRGALKEPIHIPKATTAKHHKGRR